MKKILPAHPEPEAPAGTSFPTETELRSSLGRAYAPLAKVIAWLKATHPESTVDEKFSAKSGWHRIYLLKKRRLFYLVPKTGDFRLSMILGDRTLALLTEGGFAGKLRLLLKDAKRYPEGTAFIFDRKTFDPELVIALLQAKLAR